MKYLFTKVQLVFTFNNCEAIKKIKVLEEKFALSSINVTSIYRIQSR